MTGTTRPFESDHDLLVSIASDMRHLQADLQLLKTDVHELKKSHAELTNRVTATGLKLASVISVLLLLLALFAEGLKGVIAGWVS